jgi:hypothetical protein
MNIELYPKIIFKNFLKLILFLLCANFIGIVSKFYFDHDYVYGLVPLFDFDSERNIPTLYSSFALALVSLLLFIISLIHKKNKSSYALWLGLSVIFIFLSIDEVFLIHEQLSKTLRGSVKTSGLFYYPWVIPYGSALTMLIVVYSKFLINLPKNILVLFIISGTIFVSGALGFELLEGRHAELYGTNNLLYSFLYTCEEFLEMYGIALFIYTLSTYISNQFGSLAITLTENE